jgi:hypothetical protein
LIQTLTPAQTLALDTTCIFNEHRLNIEHNLKTVDGWEDQWVSGCKICLWIAYSYQKPACFINWILDWLHRLQMLEMLEVQKM